MCWGGGGGAGGGGEGATSGPYGAWDNNCHLKELFRSTEDKVE